MSQAFRTYRQASKASKPRMKQWDKMARFACGHDAQCLSLLSEEVRLQNTKLRKPHRKVGIYRASTFRMTHSQRIVDDALFLLNHGYVSNIEEAIQKAKSNNPAPDYSSKEDRGV